MRCVDAQRIKQPHRVPRHIAEKVGNFWPFAPSESGEHFAHFGQRKFGKMRGQSGIPVVETYDAKSARREALAKRRRPADHLRAEARDQQDRRRPRGAEMIPFDFDAIGVNSCHLRLPWPVSEFL